MVSSPKVASCYIFAKMQLSTNLASNAPVGMTLSKAGLRSDCVYR